MIQVLVEAFTENLQHECVLNSPSMDVQTPRVKIDCLRIIFSAF